MSKDKWPSTESELAAELVRWLQDQQWEVYQEVQCGGPIADIVATQDARTWVIETKRTLSLDVLAQAYWWTRETCYVSIAVPVWRFSRGRQFALRIIRDYGIGLLEVSESPWGFEREGQHVREDLKPRLHRHGLRLTRLRDALLDGHKTCAPAGNADGKRWSPFRATCQEARDFVQSNPGCSVKELVDGIKTHYGSSSTARSCLAGYIRSGVVSGVCARLDGKYLRLYPIEPR